MTKCVSKSAKINEKIGKLRHSANRRGIGWYISEYKLREKLMQGATCSLSGWTLSEDTGYQNTWSLDRIDSSKDYTNENIQIVASSVNIAKHELSQEDFIEMCKDVVKTAGYIITKNEPVQQV